MRIVVENVDKTFVDSKKREVTALTNINFSIEKEEFVVLVGPSGCGKSTLLNIVGGLMSPTSGTVYFEGTNGKKPSLGIVFQEIALFPWRSVYENVIFGLEEAGASKQEQQEKGKQYIEMVGLSGFENAYPKQLSGGMRQRAGIARALAIEPDLLLMDEPFSALDAQTRTIMQEELLTIWNRTKLSTLYVTHNIQEAVYLADRVIVLSRHPGQIKSIIQIDMPKIGRDQEQYRAQFEQYADQIWQLIRHDAQEASREG
ncbi:MULTISPECIES: ABC transporter ATP-binding protein [Brevibacillus]|jgi:NitT/TauT family transport system ATP-binding protein|uniref:NitT/TauT family transport system ATP-binding protein n=2 Tax=Brevibacillus TaxID=55080 RepID=A0A1I3YJL3_9BACL|nr:MULTISPECIES: ABC transporter ATP-binding protein [Brevibacillus]MDR7315837.1 NitT/TauT family transport system ATP-binding protein [Brevibacillus nitrificans]MEC2127560.1 ABC transporter ATP-binding protein [Brevibacillus centrosporus]MED1795483.1 ABC transporter ATP-binding protein [Brevibacillus nitrificans]MED1952022.1 ABC transporter ATP-binding protein [Brevibacillus centrosporus]MED4910540.1 ABC transporter ATP-binding protein [Brevibacillus centrosporus]